MTRPIINLKDLEFTTFGKGDRFEAERAPVGAEIGAEKLGYAVIRLAPGKRAWPFHSHRVIEEMFFVLDGEGTLRHADKEYPVKQGDFICSPADPEQPHQLINTSDEPLVYLALSNVADADVMHYPDSGKFGVWAGDGADPRAPGTFIRFLKDDAPVGYWDGEVDD